HVIHTVGPVWRDGKHNEPELLASCYRNSLNLAKEHGLKTIAFPSISTGVYRFPIELAAPIAFKMAQEFITQSPNALEKIIFVLFSAQDLRVYDSIY
ncbi:MAG: macro domain-containing protein, partial [Candidatus Omnitrophica bacterium]|nr:macro domain-containing protein [Candidatus Omnitrophota bacterium]